MIYSFRQTQNVYSNRTIVKIILNICKYLYFPNKKIDKSLQPLCAAQSK